MASTPLPTAARYSNVAIALHWLLALMIVGSFGVGLYMAALNPSITKLKLYNWHKWAGVTILTLSALRLLWRLTHKPPADLPMPRWQAQAAHVTHGMLYLMFFVVPLVGWAYSSAAGFPVVWFGVLPLPDFVPVDKALAEAIKPWHGRCAWLLAVLVLAHIGAALKHHFIDRDSLLQRMRPGKPMLAGNGPDPQALPGKP
ncbi:cytochrome b [Aquabacterium sp.]|uniref:cytochrome b n=1 Tax=Aquabacterium sp. TaxID=1872578 RepID=UPI002CA24772|nr:cytochrome b [Aquabacterium sp.]HSW07740.1 cytochrome b [Aquabacterium sp.]